MSNGRLCRSVLVQHSPVALQKHYASSLQWNVSHSPASTYHQHIRKLIPWKLDQHSSDHFWKHFTILLVSTVAHFHLGQLWHGVPSIPWCNAYNCQPPHQWYPRTWCGSRCKPGMRTRDSNAITFPCPDFWNGPSHPAKTRIWIYVNSQNPQACSTTLPKAGLTRHSQKPLTSSTFWFWRCIIPLLRFPHRVLTHSLNADCVPDAEGSSLLFAPEATGKISEENPSCTFNLKAPCKQALVPSDSIHTVTETGSLQRPFLIPPNLYDSMKTMWQTSPPTATGFKPSVIWRVLQSPTCGCYRNCSYITYGCWIRIQLNRT